MKSLNSKALLPIIVLAIPILCLVVTVAGLFIGFSVTSAMTLADRGSELSVTEVETEVLNIAAEYASTKDLDAVQARLAALDLPNSEQYVSFMVDRYIQEGRGPDDVETHNLFLLATALGTRTEAMMAFLSTPTLEVAESTESAAITEPQTVALAEEPAATPTFTITPIPPTDTPVPPTETPLPPTETPIPEPTATPAPPTNTPEPTATPEPTRPPVDFVVTQASMVPNPTYNSCPGSHQIFVTVVDASGAPIDGVTVEDTHKAVPPHIAGEKGAGKLEYDLWNNGFSLLVTKKADGSPATSEVTPKLSSWDEDIPDEWLVQANYCRDLADCAQRKSANQLCRGHYSYNVTFQRTY